MEKITAKSNDLIKNVKKLMSSSKYRREEGCFVLEGARLVFDSLNSPYEIKYFLFTPDAAEKYPDSCYEMNERAQKSFEITPDIAEKLGETKNSQGIFAVCKMRENGFDFSKGSKFVALDNLQDPGNLGTVLRTAEAFGIDGVVIGGGCDIYNPKVLRSSMGSALRVPFYRCDNVADALKEFKNCGFTVYGTVPDSEAADIKNVSFDKGCVCVIGNEANGISAETKSLCDSLVTIKMPGRAESLNASVACAVVMWEMLR